MYDPGEGASGGGGPVAPRRSTSPAVSDGSSERIGQVELFRTKGAEEYASEPPFVVTVSQSCTLGGAEDAWTGSNAGSLVPGTCVGASASSSGCLPSNSAAHQAGEACDSAGSLVNASMSPGGGGAVTPALLPELFPLDVGLALSEGVRMVLSGAETECTASVPAPSEASLGIFSLHSVAERDVIVKVRHNNVMGAAAVSTPGPPSGKYGY